MPTDITEKVQVSVLGISLIGNGTEKGHMAISLSRIARPICRRNTDEVIPAEPIVTTSLLRVQFKLSQDAHKTREAGQGETQARQVMRFRLDFYFCVDFLTSTRFHPGRQLANSSPSSFTTTGRFSYLTFLPFRYNARLDLFREVPLRQTIIGDALQEGR